MVDIWLISDTHFGHKNIILFKDKDGVPIRLRPSEGWIHTNPVNRPFRDIHEHNQYLTERWNSVVKPQDHVWHGGDFGSFQVKRHLNGVINLIVGNHDEDFQHYVNGEEVQETMTYFDKKDGLNKTKVVSRFKNGFKKIRGWRYWDIGGVKFIQTHFPIYMGGGDSFRKYKFNVHGHLHSNRIDIGKNADIRYLNISVECLDDYTPIHIEEVSKILRKRLGASPSLQENF